MPPDTTGRMPGERGKLSVWCVIVVLTGLTILNVMTSLGRSGWLPRADMGNLTAMAVSAEHPEAFTRDSVFSDPDRFSFYIPPFRALLATSYRLTGGFDRFLKISSAFMLPVHLVGFVLLGMTLTRNRWAALALALFSVCFVLMPRGTYIGWAGFPYMLPRTFFLALVPYPFALAFRFGNRYRTWLLAMTLLGLLAYVHPPSAPAMALGLWCIHLLHHPSEWSPTKRILAALLLGLVFIVVIAPYGLWHTSHAQLGQSLPPGMTRQEALALIEYKIPGAFDVVGTLKETLATWTRLPLLPVSLLALAGVLFGLMTSCTRRTIAALALWALGIWGASFVVPWLEWKLSELTGSLPSQLSMVRSLRYLSLPIFALAALLPEAVSNFTTRTGRPGLSKTLKLCASASLALGVIWLLVGGPPLADTGRAYVKNVRKFRWLGQPERNKVILAEALRAARKKTPPGSLFICDRKRQGTAIRAVALRPLAHCPKDGALLVYADLAALKTWVERDRLWRDALRRAKTEGIVPMLETARALGAEYLLIRKHLATTSTDPEPPLTITYKNKRWRIIKLKPAD